MKKSIIKENKSGTILFILFLAVIICGFLFSLVHLQEIVATGKEKVLGAISDDCSVEEVPDAFEEYYDSLYSSQSWSLDMFSLTQLALGKHETRNFEVLKSDSGALYLQGTEGEIDKEQLHIMAEQCKQLYNTTKEYGGYFLYVQTPYKNVGQVSELAEYSEDTKEESESYLDSLLIEDGIPVLDLRNYVTGKPSVPRN
ncbi:hypothetical protein [Eubacterium oxidoreducens]|uniref:Uncharacterized protein n=1 Tax=Eubacterium oxidoreducens TaxID=1732 RepID=A0A1G6CCQ7_EUBOX|nr:hypothetical protein [Eubacterium oxidoreducens]SDB30676.1 hypothetical protein SAMN02910417_02269 [Eubacterium oxidoreducens]